MDEFSQEFETGFMKLMSHSYRFHAHNSYHWWSLCQCQQQRERGRFATSRCKLGQTPVVGIRRIRCELKVCDDHYHHSMDTRAVLLA
eukprot:3232915-Amphidinium_carterae.2